MKKKRIKILVKPNVQLNVPIQNAIGQGLTLMRC